MNTIMNQGALDCTKGEIVMYQPDETIKLEVRMEGETVWLNQAQIAELFGTGRQAITKHLQNIYECDELKKESTCSILELVRQEGRRMVKRSIEFYNLDAIISVGFRVNTKRGIEFRQWANRVLKEYLLRGYAVNARIDALEQHSTKQDIEIQELKSKINFFVRTSLPPVEGVFYDGQIFDAYTQITKLIKQAKRSIVLVDNYIDESTLLMLSKRDTGVTATIYTRQLTSQQQLDLTRHNSQYPSINIMVCRHNHDRFLIIDDVPYLFGASIKDAGKKLFAFIKMQGTAATDILSFIR